MYWSAMSLLQQHCLAHRTGDDLISLCAMLERRLRGHRGTITCIDASIYGLVATGSSDHTVRLFDVISSNDRCFKCFSHPTMLDIGAICLSTNHLLYCASGQSLLCFDTRMESMLVRDPVHIFSGLTSDDINCLHGSADGSHIALSDDNGFISIINTTSQEFQQLPKFHTSIAGSVSFRRCPRTTQDDSPQSTFWATDINNFDVASGGFDCQACVWGYNSIRKESVMKWSASFLEASSEAALVNPPWVQGVGWLLRGQLLTCALGDGSLQIFELPADAQSGENRPFNISQNSQAYNTYLTIKVADAHNGMITCMQSQSQYSYSSSNNCSDSCEGGCDWLATGGVDRQLTWWKITDAHHHGTIGEGNHVEGNNHNHDKIGADVVTEYSPDLRDLTTSASVSESSTAKLTKSAKRREQRRRQIKRSSDKSNRCDSFSSRYTLDRALTINHGEKLSVLGVMIEDPISDGDGKSLMIPSSRAPRVVGADAVCNDAFLYNPGEL